VTDRFEGRFSVDWPPGGGDQRCRVVAIGDDSLTAEGLDDPSQMWLARALEAIHQHTGWALSLIVIARSGTRLRDAERLARFIDDEDPGVVVLSIGTNDAIGLNDSVLATPTIGLRDYASRYRQLIRAVKGRGRTVVVTGVRNLRRTPRWQRALWPAGTVSRYVDCAIARATTDMDGVQRIDIRRADRTMWANRGWLYGQSRWQPTAAGHDVWAGLAVPSLTRALEEPRSTQVPPVGPTHGVRARSADTYKFVRTSQGVARVRDTDPRGDDIAVVVMPDSPNVLEHHESSFAGLAGRFRVVGLEMPGAGYTDLRSSPGCDLPRFDFSLDAGAGWILDVLEAIDAKTAVLTGSCVNGLYAARAAQLDPDRVRALVVCQTPSLAELKCWASTTIPPIVRHPLGDRLLLQHAKRRAAARWYRRALAPGTSREKRAWFEDVARAGFPAGSSWRLAPLINAFLGEPDDRLDLIPAPTTVLWGTDDLTHRHAGTDPTSLVAGQLPVFVKAGHFPDLEQPERFACEVVKAIAAVKARDAVDHANEVAEAMHHDHVDTEHLLLALMDTTGGVAARALADLGISRCAVATEVTDAVGEGQSPAPGPRPFTPRARKVLEEADNVSVELGHDYVGTEHLLLGLYRGQDGLASQILVKLGADRHSAQAKVTELLSGDRA